MSMAITRHFIDPHMFESARPLDTATRPDLSPNDVSQVSPTHLKAVYSVAKSLGLLLCDFSRPQPTGTLTLRVAAKRYVKLRELRIRPAKPNIANSHEWILVGSENAFLILTADLDRELQAHKDSWRFGPFDDIIAATKSFTDNARSPITELASQDIAVHNKLTTEMDSSGRFRVVEKVFLQSGVSKAVYAATILTDPPKRIARAKLKEDSTKEDPLEIAYVKNEENFSSFLRRYGVPHILPVETTPSQNIQKTRLDMELQTGGDFDTKIRSEELSPSVSAKRLAYAQQVAEAFARIHKLGLALNDIKPDNILYNPTTDEAILCDFTEMTLFGKNATRGTYPAPELAPPEGTVEPLKSVPATQQNDCWAFGLTLYALLYGPTAIETIQKALWDRGPKAILKTASAIRSSLQTTVSKMPDSAMLIIKLLSENPTLRPSMAKAAQRLKGGS